VPSSPDIVLLMTDQQRHDQVGFASGGFFETPALDDLARRGVVFRSAYSAGSTCVPARVGLLTGVQPRRLPRQPGTIALREGVWTIAHALRGAGYDTALIGKMHFTPMHADHGFDVMRTSEHLGASTHALRPDGSPDLDDYHQWLVDQGLGRWEPFEVGVAPKVEPLRPPDAGRAPFPYRLEHHATTWIEHEVRAHLEQRRGDRPLFLVVSFPHPHPPLNPLEPYASRYDEADVEVPSDGDHVNDGLPQAFGEALRDGVGRFGGWRVADNGEAALRSRVTKSRALVRHIDDTIGRLLELVPLDRTVVAFTSDHGDYAGHRGLAGKVPWIPFDDLIRVPLVLAGAGIASGREVTSLVQSCDLPLTFCDVAGVNLPVPAAEFDSRSLMPFVGPIPGTDDAERVAFFLYNSGWPGARLRSLKLIRHVPSGSRVLFDLDADPRESTNLIDDPAYRDARAELEAVVQTGMERPAPLLPTFSAQASMTGAM
jgi:arylsulfatase